jgi:Ca2+/Na+ antiporter
MTFKESRPKLYTLGCAFLLITSLGYVLASLRTPHIDPTSFEFFAYFFGGAFFAFLGALFCLLGVGRWRPLVVFVTLVVLYLWFSYITFQIMLH